jgi:hypothetical protein
MLAAFALVIAAGGSLIAGLTALPLWWIFVFAGISVLGWSLTKLSPVKVAGPASSGVVLFSASLMCVLAAALYLTGFFIRAMAIAVT